jgi:hypothetical protein
MRVPSAIPPLGQEIILLLGTFVACKHPSTTPIHFGMHLLALILVVLHSSRRIVCRWIQLGSFILFVEPTPPGDHGDQEPL